MPNLTPPPHQSLKVAEFCRLSLSNLESQQHTLKFVKYTTLHEELLSFIIFKGLRMYCMTLQRTARTGRVKIESLVINREFSQDVIKVFSQRKIVLNSWYIFSLSGSSNVVLVLINASSLLWACQLEMEK